MKCSFLWGLVAVLTVAACASEGPGSEEQADATVDPAMGDGEDDDEDEGPAADAGTAQDAGGRANDASTPPAKDASSKDARVAEEPDARSAAQRDAAADASQGATSADASTASDAGGGGAKLPPASSTSMDGPFRAMQNLRGGPKGRSGLFYPAELGRDGVKHPVFVWGCGGGSTPSSYADMLLRVASHGFVVIAEVAEIGDNGAPLKAAIDWMLAEHARNGSPFFGALETTKIALGGHSIGSANSFYIADDPRLTTTIHVAGGSLDDVRDPRAPTTGMGGKRLVHPVAYVCSMSDTFGNVEKTEKDYENTTAPAWMTVMTGTNHTGAARSGMPAIIAWLRWHLAGESERRAAFLEAGGEYAKGIFVSKHKNW